MDVKVAQCNLCGQRYFAWDEESVLEKFKSHVCMMNRADREIAEILDRILNEEN